MHPSTAHETAARDVADRLLRDAYEANPVARKVGSVVLRTYGGYTVRQALGISGCLAIANALHRIG